VNIASRMESQGTPGRIQITEPTHELLSGEFEYEPRGTVSVKGKGEMETWYLVGRREAVSDRADPWGARGGTP
jgi:class 3 adenylate cyclase